ncbi:Glycerate dehydrogenase [Capsicum chinense]|nr:Glycerate dehydrogenase [Capsicum chinense]
MWRMLIFSSRNLSRSIFGQSFRWPVIDEVALVELLRENPMFRVGLDVFEDEPYMKAGLADMKNVVVVPT